MAKKKGNSDRKSIELERLRQQKIEEEEEAERKAQEEAQLNMELMRKKEIQEKMAQSLVELAKLDEIKTFISSQQELTQLKEFSDYNWDKYTRCDGMIDPQDLKQVNTFISLWLEHGSNEIETILKICSQVIKMLDEISYLKKFAEYTKEVDFVFLENIKSMLLDAMGEKIDMGTFKILENAIGYEIDFDSGNLELIHSIGDIVHCLWVNLSKSIKTTTHKFSLLDFTFDVPRSIQSSDIAVRLIWENFDNLTPISASSHIRKNFKISSNVKIVTNLINVDEELKGNEEIIQECAEEEKILEDTNGGENNEESNKENVEIPPKEEESEEETSEFGEFDMDAEFVDMRCYRTIGGLFHMEILSLPLQPIVMKHQLVLKLSIDNPWLKKFKYSAETPTENEDQSEEVIYGNPIRIQLKLSDNFLITEQPDVVCWDSQSKNWRSDFISETNYDQNNRMLSFLTSTIDTFAIIQELHIHMPYQSWEIRPRSYNHVTITMVTSIVEFEIEIKEDLLCMGSMQEYHDLDHMLGKWMSLENFSQALYNAGINIFPQEDSNYFLKMNKKTKKLTNKVYSDISVTAPMMGFAYSHFNSQTEKDTAIVQMAKPNGDEPINESDWVVVMNCAKYVECLKVSEFETQFSKEPLNYESKFHSTLYHVACDRLNKEFFQNESWKLCKTLELFIKKINILNYSV